MSRKLRNPFNTAQKMKFSIKDFFSKGDQIRNFLLWEISIYGRKPLWKT